MTLARWYGIVALSLVLAGVGSSLVFAQGVPSDITTSPFVVDCDPRVPPAVTGRTGKPGCGIPQFLELVRNFTRWATFATIWAAVIFIVYAGFLIMFSAGNTEAVVKGKKTIKIALTGVIIALLSYLIVNAIYLGLTGGSVENRLSSSFEMTPRAFAQGDGEEDDNPFDLTNPIGTTSFVELFRRFTNYAFTLAVPTASVMIVVAAFIFLFSSGNTERVEMARKAIIYTLVGFALIGLSWSIVNLIWLLVRPAGAPP